MTIATRIFTWWKGEPVGSDDSGNRYYREKSPPEGRRERRWVIYEGEAEASRVPPEWHAWLHHTVDEVPPEAGRRGGRGRSRTAPTPPARRAPTARPDTS